MTRSLVTGAAGFVGRHLVTHLHANGDDVVATDPSDGGPDITDAAALGDLIAGSQPEVVYHLAGWSDVGRSWDDPAAVLHANVIGTETVLRTAADHRVRRVLVVTSADVYGTVAPERQPIGEHAPLRPESPYAASKAAAEMLAIQAGLGRGLDVVRARSFNHAGPGQKPGFVIPALADRILAAIEAGHDTLAVGALDPTRDFTDVRDVVRAYRLLAHRGAAGEAYNVCSGTEITIGEVCRMLIDGCGAPLEPRTDPALLRPSEVMRRVGDPAKLVAATGWRPSIALATTLADVVDDRRAARTVAQGGSPCP